MWDFEKGELELAADHVPRLIADLQEHEVDNNMLSTTDIVVLARSEAGDLQN